MAVSVNLLIVQPDRSQVQVSRAEVGRWREHIQAIKAAASTIPLTNAAKHENSRKLSSTRLMAQALTRFGSVPVRLSTRRDVGRAQHFLGKRRDARQDVSCILMTSVRSGYGTDGRLRPR